MVSRRIVSRFTCSPPQDEGECRKIDGGWLYSPAEVLKLLEDFGDKAVSLWTRKCREDAQKWSIDNTNLCEVMKEAVQSGTFLGAEWCEQRPGGPWAACDAYYLVRPEWVQYANKMMDTEYYIKFAIAQSGALLLVVSCHPPEDKR